MELYLHSPMYLHNVVFSEAQISGRKKFALPPFPITTTKWKIRRVAEM